MTYTMTRGRDTILINTETGSITGGTYAMKEIIKSDLYATWDPTLRVWHMDDAESIINKYRDYLTRCYKLEAIETPTSITVRAHTAHDGLCPYCHTYCNGDCTASR